MRSPQGFCIRGDVCPYAHGVFECWLHPSRYRTQLCKDGANCHRPVCFFAHSLPELRAPTYTWVPGPADLARPALPISNGGARPTPAIVINGAADGVSGNGGSPVTGVGADARGLLSHASSCLPVSAVGAVLVRCVSVAVSSLTLRLDPRVMSCFSVHASDQRL